MLETEVFTNLKVKLAWNSGSRTTGRTIRTVYFEEQVSSVRVWASVFKRLEMKERCKSVLVTSLPNMLLEKALKCTLRRCLHRTVFMLVETKALS